VFNRTLSSVSQASRDEQAPWFSSSLVDEFSFSPTAPATASARDREADARNEYQSAERVGTRRAWEDFLSKYPSGRYADLARDRLAKLTPAPATTPKPDPDAAARNEYQSAERLGTRKGWEDFLLKYPSGRYADLARDRLAKLTPAPATTPRPDAEAAARNEYQSAERLGTRKGWEDFLLKYPSGRYADLARDRLAKLTPAPATTPKPDAEAAARNEYQSAERLGTRRAWEDFLFKYPSGRYADLARDRLAKLAKPDTRPDDPAIRELDRKLEINPSDAAAFYRRGQLFAQFGDYQRAIDDFDQVLRLNPKDPEALNNRCWTRALLGELQSAMQDCDQALQIRPRYVDALDSRAFVSLKLNQPSKAIADYDLAIRINPRHASSLYGRGIAKLRIGNTSAGNNDIAAAKAIQPAIADEFAGYGLRPDNQRP